MRNLHLFLPLLAVALSCSSQKEQPSTSTSESSEEIHGFTVPENTIYKVYPDGTKHILQEKILNSNGDIEVERRFISRVEPEDSTGYFHSLWKEFQYKYDDAGRIQERLTYRTAREDSLILESKEEFKWKGDTAIRMFAYVKYRSDELGEFEEKDRTVYDDQGRVIYSKVHDSFEMQYVDGERVRVPKYVAKKFTYKGDQLVSVEIVNRDDYSNIEAFGNVILSNSILKRTYRDDGSILSDTILSVEYDLSVYEAKVRLYNEYNELTIIKMGNGNPRTEDVYWTDHDQRPPGSIFLPAADLDPMVEVKGHLSDPVQTVSNWKWQHVDIKKSTYTYSDDNYIQTRTDEFEEPQYNSDLISRVTNYHYDENKFLVQLTVVSTYQEGNIVNETIDCERYSDGGLKEITTTNDGLITRKIRLSPTGMYRDVLTQNRINDSTITGHIGNFDLSVSYRQAGDVHIKNGMLIKGTIVFKDEAGRVVRYFDEAEQNLDAEFFYTEEGDMAHSTHRKIRYTVIPESMNEDDVYTLYYGEGYSYQTLLKSPFVPEFTLP